MNGQQKIMATLALGLVITSAGWVITGINATARGLRIKKMESLALEAEQQLGEAAAILVNLKESNDELGRNLKFLQTELKRLAALPDYTIVSKETYGIGRANIAYRVSVSGEVIPSEADLKKVALGVLQQAKGYRDECTVFIYIQDMPTDNAAYVVAEGDRSGLKSFRLNEQALEFWQLVKSQG